MLSKLFPKRGENGFTLIELLIVVIIIGVLAAIALPIFINQQKQAVEASVKSDARNTVTNVVNWFASHQTATPADVTAYATAGGKVARSNDKTFVAVNFTAPGDYTVCAYNTGASVSKDADNAVVFTSSTGKFTAGDCNLATDAAGNAGSTGGSNSGGNGSTGTGVTHTLNLVDDNWNANSSAKGTSANYSFVVSNTDEEFTTDSDSWEKMNVSGALAPLFGTHQSTTCGTNRFESGFYSLPRIPVAQSDVHMYDENNNEITQNNSGDWYVSGDTDCWVFPATSSGAADADNSGLTNLYLVQDITTSEVNEDAVAYRIDFKVNGQNYELKDRTALCSSGSVNCS